MFESPSDIENLPGFMDWLLGEPEASRGEPAAVVEVHGIGCTFSRPVTEEERAAILGFLRNHAEGHKEFRLTGALLSPLAEISGARIDEIRSAVSVIVRAGDHDGHWPDMQSTVALAFGARRDAAEKKNAKLGSFVYGGQILESDGDCMLVGNLQIPLDQGLGTAAEIQRYIEGARKEIGAVELDVPPVYRAEVSMLFDTRAAAEALRPRFDAAGLTTEIVERVGKSVFYDVVRWQERWLVQTGRVERLMRPGVLSAAGFLGETERLEDVLKEDARNLSAMGITAAEVAGRLRVIVGEAIRRSREAASEKDTYVIGRFRVRLTQWHGYQECPWLCEPEPAWASIDFRIEDRRSGAKLGGPGLIVHLIAEHGFFEGKDSPYRVDPRQAAEVLGLPESWWDRLWRR